MTWVMFMISIKHNLRTSLAARPMKREDEYFDLRVGMRDSSRLDDNR
jgi:hypothetical protein